MFLRNSKSFLFRSRLAITSGYLIAVLSFSARADFATVWALGTADDSAGEFSQENGSSNAAPGSATVLDDDYYFAGIYPAPIGTRAANEPVVNFERAMTTWDPTERLHFNLTGAQAAGTARFNVTFRLIWGGGIGAGFGSHTVQVKMNGHALAAQTFVQAGTMIVAANASAVAPVTGDNILEISRTGGTQNAWIQFDYLTFEADPTALVDTDGDGLPQWWERDNGLSDNDASDAPRDSDHDGLTNTQELVRGTNPWLADTDGDGLKDGVETGTGVYVSAANTGTNALVVDTDGDSLNDWTEVSLGSNPLLTDTDGDGAPDAWEVRTGYSPASAASTPPAFPYAIGVKFISEMRPDDALSPLEVTGFVPQMKWNNTKLLAPWNPTSGNTTDIVSPTAQSLVNSAGTSTTATIAWSSDNTWMSGNGGGSNQKLLDGFLAVWGDTPAEVTLGSIPFATDGAPYDVLVYVGAHYDGARGYARLNGLASTDRYFQSGSMRPETGFTEPVGSTAARPWRGNVIRFRNVTGATCKVQLFRGENSAAGLHAIQIVKATADTDGDGLPDWWEFMHQLKPNLASDASADIDGDGLTNLQEFQRGTNPRLADTDGDGLNDSVETNTGNYAGATNTGTNPLLADTDSDGLTDGAEVNAKPSATNPNLADTDGDGRGDAEELAQGTNSLVSDAANAFMPVVTTSPRTFTWTLDNVQLVWDHDRGHAANGPWTEDYLFSAAIDNAATQYGNALRVGVRVRDGRLTHFFYSGHEGAFSYPGQPTGDIWESDWNATTDKTAALGFSGYGRADLSARLRFRVTGSSTGSQSTWSVTFELRNMDSNAVVATQTFTGCTLASNVHNNTATWRNEDDPPKANRLVLWKHAGVDVYFRSTPLGNIPAFAAFKDTDHDGLPDVWEDARGLNKNSAADATLDADNDGANNRREYLAGTDPQNADTDGDGVKDGAELNGGSDPLLASSKPAYFKGLPAGIVGEDLNGNGLPDAWELWAGSFSLQGSSDSDRDGYNDAQEAAAGTNPFDAASHPWGAALAQGNDFVLRWPRLLNKRHRVWWSDDLSTTWTLSTGSPAPVGTEFRQTFVGALSLPKRFYKVDLGDLDTDGDGVSDWTEVNVLNSDPLSANSLRAALPMDTNNDGAPDTTVSGDYAALLERFQGASAGGGFANAGGSTGTGISRTQAARFLTQATFGPIPQDIERVQQLGYAAWIDEQLAKPATLHSAYIQSIYADFNGPRADRTYLYSETDNFIFGNNLPTAFARAAVLGEDQLRQRVAFALSQILVTSRRDANLENRPLGMADYYDTFVRRAFGNYYDVLNDVAFHPCMGRYLSHVGNQKANPAINQYPDENFAREVMQLFTIGLWELNADGSRKVNAQGQNIPTYTNQEITQFARVYTGLWFGGQEWGNGGWTDSDYATPMTMHADRHDFGAKTLLGGFVLPARAPGDAEAIRDIADALRHLFQHANTAPFISRALIQFLVTDNPTPAYVQRVAAVFANNGSGVRGDLGAVVKAILLDVEARDSLHENNVVAQGRLKEPVIRAMALARAFGMRQVPNLIWWDWGDFYDSARQSPTYSPSVFNFYRPEYRAPGLLTQNDLAGPVFQITDSYSSISFPNKVWNLIESGFTQWGSYQFPLDLGGSAILAATPELLVDHLNTLFCAGHLSAASRTIILNAINQIPADQPEARARIAAYLAAVSPEGAVMK